MKKNFDFVNVTPGENNSDYKRQVHVQAMRSFRRQQRLRNVEAYERQTGKAAAQKEDSEESPEESPPQETVLDQSAYVGASTIDPFKALPAGFDEHQDLLLYFQHRIGPILLPDDAHQPDTSWSTKWLRKAVTSPLMLSATCSHAAAFFDDVQGQPFSPRALQFQNQTIRLLNEALEEGVGDEAIGSVLMLVANTIITGSSNEMQTHMLALDRMVSMRGGRENIGEESTIQMGMLWYEQPGPLNLTKQTDNSSRQLGAFYAFQNMTYWSAILKVPRVPSVDTAHELSTLLSKCRDLTRIRIELESARGVTQVQLRQFSDQRSILECQLGRLRHQLRDQALNDRDHSLMLNRAKCIAGLFYAFFYLRRFLMGGSLTDDLIDELVQVLNGLDEAGLAGGTESTMDDRKAALWAATIASRFAQTHSQLDFTRRFAQKLAQSLNCASMNNWLAVLGGFAWPGDAWNSTIVDLNGQPPS
ncbi:hypothetical protein PRZ48_009585 [Zasmidium cellare]|uniref:Uncharacterized protein n=1 Tax=Zasmidium cellare TaxID=395010 RepID=A0ABR0EDC1_ZASCE|nr:hypothetical protein PRZ48_009585 [Zasmidium cellare]